MHKQDSFSFLQEHQRRRDHYRIVCLVLILAVALLLSLCAGDVWIWPTQWFEPEAELFVWQLRLPRTLAVVVVGAGLASAGAVMQALFDNPLAEPGLLGVANGAGVALVMTILLGQGLLPIWFLSLAAILGALFITFLLLSFARFHSITNARLLLIGVAISIICSALMSWAVYFSSSLDLRQLMYWLMGGFSGIDWRHKWLVGALFPALIWLCLQGRVLNLLALGESQARQLGLPIKFWRNILVFIVGWIVGISVALAGVISFVGLIIPHMLRLIGITDHRTLLPSCALAGAAILLLADLLARIAMNSAELPIGIVTATFGAPLFIWMLLKRGEIQ